MKKIFTLIISIGVLCFLTLCSENTSSHFEDSIYKDTSNWAYFPQTPENETDVFFVGPTVYLGDSINFAMSLDDSIIKGKFLGAINMEKGIYDQDVNFYAPYYRQVSMSAFKERGYSDISSNSAVNTAFETAYSDVVDAFKYYLTQSNNPFILAGFSQGSEHLIDLVKNEFDDPDLQERHIATYAIGWRLEEEDVNKFDHLKNAQKNNDLGVIICYSSEADFIEKSLIVPDKTLSINPLSWTTDTTLADKDLNLGACFTNYSGEIVREIPKLTGAYICPERGTLKITDVTPEHYPAVISIFNDGEYHIYDYQFFYRNLQKNIRTRIACYKEKHGSI